MLQLTGILGTMTSKLGQFQLGAGRPESATAVADTATVATTVGFEVDQGPWKRLIETIVVSPSILATRELPRSIADSATVTSLAQSLLATGRVTYYAVDIVYRRAPIENVVDSITVTPDLHRLGSVPESVSDSIATAQTITLAPTHREFVTDQVTITPTISERSTHPRLTVSDAIGVATVANGRDSNIRLAVADAIAVAQTTTFPVYRFRVQDAITVTPTVAERNTSVRLAVTSAITTGQTATIGSFLHHLLEDTISVTSTPFGRNNNVRIGVTTSIGIGTPTNGRDDNDRQSVVDTMNIAGQARVTDQRILIPETDSMTVTDKIFSYKSPVQINLANLITVTDVVGGGSSQRRITVQDQITVATNANPKRPAFTVLDSIAVSPNVGGGSPQRTITVTDQVFAAGQALQRDSVSHQSVIDQVNVTHIRYAQGPRVSLTVIDTVAVALKISDTAPRHMAVEDDIAVSPAALPRATNVRFSMEDDITVTPTYRANLVPVAVADTVTVSWRAWQPNIEVITRIHVNSDPRRMFEQSVADSVSVTPTIDRKAEFNPRIIQTLPITDSVVRGVTVDRSIIQTLPIPEGMYKLRIFLPDPITVPVAVGTLVTNYCVLQSKSGAITLPAPLLGDGQDNVDKITIHRAMSGGALVFKNTSLRRKLRLSFRLDKVKAFELRLFLQANLSETIYLTTQDGEKWVVQIPDAPVEIQQAGRGAEADEFATWQIAMEGQKISG